MSNTEQRTVEWRKQRVGKITGSRVGAVLNCSPFSSRKKVMREMVDEMLGNLHDIDSPPLRWGVENEPTACKLYEFLYAGDEEVNTTGFWEKGDLGASPDLLVGEMGLAEIKCPYGLRNDESPVFKSIFDEDMQHYWHQIQMQLYVTDRQWCDFFQWTPHDQRCERVERSERWLENHEDDFAFFMEDLHKLLEKASHGGSEERLAMSARWAAACERYALAAAEEDRVSKELKEAKQELVDMCQASDVDHCQGAGYKVQKIERKGSIDYKALAKDNMREDELRDIEEDYRRKGSVSWTVKESKGDE